MISCRRAPPLWSGWVLAAMNQTAMPAATYSPADGAVGGRHRDGAQHAAEPRAEHHAALHGERVPADGARQHLARHQHRPERGAGRHGEGAADAEQRRDGEDRDEARLLRAAQASERPSRPPAARSRR